LCDPVDKLRRRAGRTGDGAVRRTVARRDGICMHVILTPVGSAGDVDPFVVVGAALRGRGHRITLVAAEPFAGVAARGGLEFVPLGTTEEYERITSDPNLWDARRGPRIVFDAVTAQLARAYRVLEQLWTPHGTVLVGHPLAFATRTFEEAHQTPAATVHLAPSLFRSDLRQPVLPSGRDPSNWPRPVKRAFWWAVDRFGIDPLIAPALNRWRADLRLPPVSRVFSSWLHSPHRVLAFFPGWFGEPQPDWPPQTRLTGFVLSDETCAPVRDGGATGLESFVSGGDPPVVFTPGSANRHAGAFFRTAIEATRHIGRRALLVTGFEDHLPDSLPPHVRHERYVPFRTLFPRAAAVVHHGGIGTCAQALAAGIPQLLMPMGFDQPDNAARLVRLGAGESIRPGQFTPERVARALDRLTSSPTVAAACGACREKIAAVDAVGRACGLIEELYERTRIG
jgi:rhamnosyltransferase subunit B